MKRITFLLLLQLLFSIISGFLIAQMSFIGKIGIKFFYQEYGVFRSWWKTALLLFGIQLILILLQHFLKKNWLSWALMAVAILGLVFTFNDFNNTFSYRLLKEKFHVGFYLFWLSWTLHTVYFLLYNKNARILNK